MRASILNISGLSLLGFVLAEVRLPTKGSRHRELPAFAPRILQWQKGAPKDVYPPPSPVAYSWTTHPTTASPYPTTAGSVPPSSPPMTYFPTIVASKPTVPTQPPSMLSGPPQPSIHQAACSAALQGTVYETPNAVILAYFYELLTLAALNVTDATSEVDKAIQNYLAPKLVGCQRRRRMIVSNTTILGVSQSTSDTPTSSACLSLSAQNGTDEVCYTFQTSVTVYLEENNADASLSSNVYGTLSNGLASLVNQQNGIYGLFFIGANLPAQQPAETSSSPNAVQFGQTASTASSGLTLTPGSVVVIGAVGLTVLAVAFLVFRRGKKWPATHKAGIIKMQMEHNDKAISLDDEKSTPTANASFEKEVGMFVEYDDDESNGYGKILANRPILKDMDQEVPSPTQFSRKSSWFSARSRSPQFGAEEGSIEIPLPSPARSPARKYSVDDTVEF